jgi:hypothetical protein
MLNFANLPTRNFFSEASSLTVSIWLLVWSLRSRGELDLELDQTAKRIRWSMVAMGIFIFWASAEILAGCAWCVLAGWIWATAFLAWPNFAYHLAALLRKLRLI